MLLAGVSGDLPPVLITADEAAMAVLAHSEYATLSIAGAPQLVVYAGSEVDWADATLLPPAPVVTWRILVTSDLEFRAYSVFVNAESGEIAHSRSEVAGADVIGTVKAFVTPSNPGMAVAAHATFPPVLTPLAGIRVSVDGTSASAVTDTSGNFAIPGFSQPVTVRANLADGSWVEIEDNEGLGVALEVATTANPGTSVDLVFNATLPQDAFPLAQVNAFYQVSLVHQFFKERTSWTGLDFPLLAIVNSVTPPPSGPSGICDAKCIIGFGLAFGQGANPPIGGCANTAFSSIVAHEYGHFVENQLGLLPAGSGFGEGFADALSLLVFDESVIGRGFSPTAPSSSFLRDYGPTAPDLHYPCSPGGGGPGAYECGKVLAGLWRDILEQYRADGDPNTDLSDVQKLFVNWMFVTNGGAAQHAAHPLTLVEILLTDDDDGNLSNGTPHRPQICAAGLQHGLVITFPGSQTCHRPPPGTHEIVSFRSPVRMQSSVGGLNGQDPFGIAVGQLNTLPPANDSLNDVVLACEGSDKIFTYLALPAPVGSYAFDAPKVTSLAAGSKPAKVALADMAVGAGADGHLDVVVALQTSGGNPGQVQILRNDGQGTLVAQSPIPLTGAAGGTIYRPIGVVVGNWDNNHGNDIAIAGYQLDGGGIEHPVLGLLWSNGSGGFTLATVQTTKVGRGYDLTVWNQGTVPSPAYRFALTNETQSSLPGEIDYVWILNHGGAQSITEAQWIATRFASRGAIAANIAGDALPDVVCTSFGLPGDPNPNRVNWSIQPASGPFPGISDFPVQTWMTVAQPQGLAAGLIGKRDTFPVTLDSRVDVAVASPVPDPGTSQYTNVVVLRNTGSTPQFELLRFPVTLDWTEASYPRQVLVVDIDGDGFPDILTANRGTAGAADSSEGFSVLINRK